MKINRNYTLNPKRTVFLFGEINNEVAIKTINQLGVLAAQNRDPVTIILSSVGGQCSAGFVILDFLRCLSLKLVMIGSGDVSSMAIPIYCAGHERYVTQHTLFMFHELGTKRDERMPVAELEANAAKLGLMQLWYSRRVAMASKARDLKMIKQLMLGQKCISAVEALKLGIAHGFLEKLDIPLGSIPETDAVKNKN